MLLNDPLYLGNRHSRTTGKAYDDFIAFYLQTVSELFPNALYHFEDFGPSNARRILDDNAGTYRIFNDDVQGTGAIVLASVISALKVTRQSFRDQRLVVFGSGTAGCGIADALRDAMINDGAGREEAVSQIWLVDKPGLLKDDMTDLRNYQQPYARPAAEIKAWGGDGTPDLLTTIKHVKPTILLGTSTVHGAFTKPIIDAMCAVSTGRSSCRSPTRPRGSRRCPPTSSPGATARRWSPPASRWTPSPTRGSTTRSARPTTPCSTPVSPWARSSAGPST